MGVEILRSALVTSQNRCSGVHVNISPFEKITQNLSKNTSGAVTLCYQVNLAIDIPIITENYINSHLSLVTLGYLNCLFKYRSLCWEVFDWSDYFYSESTQS